MARRLMVNDGPHPVDVYVGHRLKTRRSELGISQTALGEKIGVTFQQVQKYERGANRISASMLYDIATALSVQIAYFFEDIPDRSVGDAVERSQIEEPGRLSASMKSHRLLLGILALPAPVRTKISSLVLALDDEAPDSEDEE